MLVSKFNDGKSTPVGRALAIADGKPIKKCRGMIYWLRWGNHTFDIRVMWSILGLHEEKYFIEADLSNDRYILNHKFHSSFIDAIKDKDFPALMVEHDAIC